MIRALWDGKKLSGEGDHFAADGAFIHTLPEGRRPPIYVSAFTSMCGHALAGELKVETEGVPLCDIEDAWQRTSPTASW